MMNMDLLHAAVAKSNYGASPNWATNIWPGTPAMPCS